MKLLLVSSVGGHLSEVMQLAPVFRAHETVLVVNDRVDLPEFPFTRIYRIVHAERDVRVAWNFFEAASILRAERPDVIFSMGAGCAPPFFWLGRALGCRTVYVETAAAVTRPSLTGRLVYGGVDAFFYQWRELARFFPDGVLAPVMGWER